MGLMCYFLASTCISMATGVLHLERLAWTAVDPEVRFRAVSGIIDRSTQLCPSDPAALQLHILFSLIIEYFLRFTMISTLSTIL